MSISVQWGDEEKTILVYTFNGNWNWDEFYRVMDESYSLLDGVGYKVDVITDLRNSRLLPDRMLSHLGSLRGKTYNYMDKLVLVGANLFMQSISRLFLKMNPGNQNRFSMVSTMEEAYEILQQSRLQ